jgi:hypothetical protein
MYKLIIGNVRITVLDDLSRDAATEAARQAISAAQKQGKLLSHIEISASEVKTTEKVGHKTVRKSIKQSMLDSMNAAIKEKLFPSSAYVNKDCWCDNDTGQEWHGNVVDDTKAELLKAFEEWAAAIK